MTVAHRRICVSLAETSRLGAVRGNLDIKHKGAAPASGHDVKRTAEMAKTFIDHLLPVCPGASQPTVSRLDRQVGAQGRESGIRSGQGARSNSSIRRAAA